jgi:hypothetical protein
MSEEVGREDVNELRVSYWAAAKFYEKSEDVRT